jgi:mannose-6-phosphate isomerase-like protein (cupin superfamily)
LSLVRKPSTVLKGWGDEKWIVNNSEYCGKILHVNSGMKVSFHFHINKLETFCILRGEIIMRLIHKNGAEEEFIMREGDILDIPRGLVHQFEGITDADIVEFSTTHNDEDSYRVIKGD